MEKINQKDFDKLVNDLVEEKMNSYEFEQGFDDFLDECQPEGVNIGSLNYSASAVLKAVDPVAYRCSFNDDYCESERERLEEEAIEELEEQYEVV